MFLITAQPISEVAISLIVIFKIERIWIILWSHSLTSAHCFEFFTLISYPIEAVFSVNKILLFTFLFLFYVVVAICNVEIFYMCIISVWVNKDKQTIKIFARKV